MGTQSHGDTNCGWRADTAEYDGEDLAQQWSKTSWLARPELNSPDYSDGATFNSNDSFPGSNASMIKYPSDAAQTEVDDNTQGHLHAPQAHAQESSSPKGGKEASQFYSQSPRCSQVLLDATRIADAAADAHKRVLQRQMSVEERGCEADALLEEIAKAGSSKAAGSPRKESFEEPPSEGLLEAAMLAEMALAEPIGDGSPKSEAAAQSPIPSSNSKKESEALAPPAVAAETPPLAETPIARLKRGSQVAATSPPGCITAPESQSNGRSQMELRSSPEVPASHTSQSCPVEELEEAGKCPTAASTAENQVPANEAGIPPTAPSAEDQATPPPTDPTPPKADGTTVAARAAASSPSEDIIGPPMQLEFTVTPPTSQAVSPPSNVPTPEPCAASVPDHQRAEHLDAQQLGHSLRPPELGMLARIIGDGWGGGDKRKRAEGTITEADEFTFTVIVKESDTKWTETHVLREHCVLIEGSKPTKRHKK